MRILSPDTKNKISEMSASGGRWGKLIGITAIPFFRYLDAQKAPAAVVTEVDNQLETSVKKKKSLSLPSLKAIGLFLLALPTLPFAGLGWGFGTFFGAAAGGINVVSGKAKNQGVEIARKLTNSNKLAQTQKFAPKNQQPSEMDPAVKKAVKRGSQEVMQEVGKRGSQEVMQEAGKREKVEEQVEHDVEHDEENQTHHTLTPQ